MKERDERPLAAIKFECPEMREYFAAFGVKIAQDIVDMGCTGLVLRIRQETFWPEFVLKDGWNVVRVAQYTQGRMGGSLCGLPCYVPPDRFCLVHNTVGALQLQGNQDGPQAARHPEGVPLCSRELTADELTQLGLIREKIVADAAVAARDLGGEVLDEDARVPDPLADTSKKASNEPVTNGSVESSPAPGGGNLVSGEIDAWRFRCPEHSELNLKCRFCLAQAVAEGPLEPPIWVRAWTKVGDEPREVDPHGLPVLLKHNGDEGVELRVLAARWDRRLVRR